MVECTALEMRHRCKPIGGSNPSLSANTAKVTFNNLISAAASERPRKSGPEGTQWAGARGPTFVYVQLIAVGLAASNL